jgi:protein-ribulosamine 3-kinase
MFLSAELTGAIEIVLKHSDCFSGPPVVDGRVASGISECLRVKSGNRCFFVKINDAGRFPRMFALEAHGLRELSRTGTIAVPHVLGTGVQGDQQFLLQEWLASGPDRAAAHETMGRQLARLHRTTSVSFGLDYDNYIGSLIQINAPKGDWTDFFTAHRLEPLIQMAEQNNLIDKGLRDLFERLTAKLDSLYPKEKPALIHGDLWSGNYLITDQELPVLLDPAIYYGHREMDLAMSALFGGFRPEFYQAYHEEYPLEKGWQERLSLWNLYPLLVHLNLFGSGYLVQIKTILKAYG